MESFSISGVEIMGCIAWHNCKIWQFILFIFHFISRYIPAKQNNRVQWRKSGRKLRFLVKVVSWMGECCEAASKLRCPTGHSPCW